MIRLCIIGKNLNRKAIAAQLDELLCKENEIIGRPLPHSLMSFSARRTR